MNIDFDNISEIYLSLCFALIILEIILPSFISLGFAIGFAGLAIICKYYDMTTNQTILYFSLISFVSFLVLRLIFKRKNDTKSSSKDVNEY